MSADLKVLIKDLDIHQLRDFFEKSVKPGSIDPLSLSNAILALELDQYRVLIFINMFIRQNRYKQEDLEKIARVCAKVANVTYPYITAVLKPRVTKKEKEEASKAVILNRNVASFLKEAIYEPVRLELR